MFQVEELVLDRLRDDMGVMLRVRPLAMGDTRPDTRGDLVLQREQESRRAGEQESRRCCENDGCCFYRADR